MSYVKQNFTDGNVLTAAQLNHIEDGLATVEKSKAEIDDTIIGGNTWSSRHIVDILCPPLEESGNPVVCHPIAGYPLEVKAKWKPMQEGSGTPYPAGGGKQLLDINKCMPTVEKPYGMTITIDGDVFKASGVPNEEVTETGPYSFAVGTCSQEELRGKGYKVTAWVIKGKVNNAWGLRTENESSLAVAAELTPGVNNDIQLRLMVSKDTPSAWEPYENIRPIKGRDNGRVERYGENLLNIKPFDTYTSKGITFEYVPEGGIHIQGTASVNTDSPTFPVWHLPPGKYYGLNMDAGIAASIVVRRNGSNLWLNTKGIFEILAGDVTKYWYVIVTNGATLDNTIYPYIVPGTTAPTTYTPYIGRTNTLTLPETVYGGEVDAVTGEGQREWRYITITGQEPCHIYSTLFYVDFYKMDSFVAEPAFDSTSGKCSHYPYQLYKENGFIGIALDGGAAVYSPGAKYPITNDGLREWMDYLAAQYAAGTPVQIAYKLAAPTPFTAAGSTSIEALSGTNTVLTDADSVMVTSKNDPIQTVSKLSKRIAALEAAAIPAHN